MPGNPDEIKMVSNAMTNITRRTVMKLLTDGGKTVKEIEEAVGKSMLDYHLKILEQAGLINLDDSLVNLSDFGRNFIEGRSKKAPENTVDFSSAKPVEIVEVRQLLPCIADSTKFRIIANMAPPLGSALKVLEPLFTRGRYSEKIGAMIIQRGDVLITIYGTGNVTMTMIKDEDEARLMLKKLRDTINEAIKKGVPPPPREKIRIEPMEIYKYLPQTNCGECGEQSCYTFAIRLMGREISLDLCSSLKEQKYKLNLEHLQVLVVYI